MILVFNGRVTIVLQCMGRDFLTRFPPSPLFWGRARFDKTGELCVLLGLEGHESRSRSCAGPEPQNSPGSGLRRVWEVEDEPFASTSGG